VNEEGGYTVEGGYMVTHWNASVNGVGTSCGTTPPHEDAMKMKMHEHMLMSSMHLPGQLTKPANALYCTISASNSKGAKQFVSAGW
jgi:hypothetical protein